MSLFIQHKGGGMPMRAIAESPVTFTVKDPESGLFYILEREEYEVVAEPIVEPVAEPIVEPVA